ncbi:PTS sugar transporter subunit IIA [Alphaproteobacteria bacterium]|nr:PTS sugar transporter subunit IIA [Alphaproteobacteria bacterium]MDC1023454.1 PTS sugar transporter subunit IIA [Alphaproteobacteria bacterium]
MNINEMLTEHSILVDFKASTKKHILDELSKLAEKEINVSYKVILDNLTKREKLGSTAVGNGIAIPHATEVTLDKPKVFLAILSKGLDFNANDDQPVDIIFLLLAPSNNGSEHLQALASVSRLLRNNDFVSKLRGCKSIQSALAVISQTMQDEAA